LYGNRPSVKGRKCSARLTSKLQSQRRA